MHSILFRKLVVITVIFLLIFVSFLPGISGNIEDIDEKESISNQILSKYKSLLDIINKFSINKRNNILNLVQK